ncbi:MAG: 2,3-bisphosphoglycerate-independent phosphoglycerate mutase [Candidatus Obscuribacterales bacterium]|nr:2,3-bisphosphoglycerate-independent phosphoglycerate mutase [Candidatus Obscuribacterales bacterium]
MVLGPLTLLILDGWGVSSEQKGNAILAAKTPNYDYMRSHFANSLLDASGAYVGLPPGLMGNSEVGHLNIGAGRVVIQKLTQISQTIIDGSFFKNPALLAACQAAKAKRGALHIIGLVSDGCVHSSPDHLDGLLQLAYREGISEIIVHPILDGRDTPPRSALRFMRELEAKLQANGGKIGVVCGRYYAMDRDNRWERVERYWRALVLSEGLPAGSAVEAVNVAYDRDENDEFILPAIVTARPIKDGDSVICFNFRPDRVRQISRCLTTVDFAEFARPLVPDIYYACMTEYDSSLKLPVAFSPEQLPSQDMEMTLPELLACHKVHQLHLAETEKYAHVTYFFNGGKEAENELEERVLVPSLKVATYDKAPAMQTPLVCDMACQAIESGKYPFLVVNFANPDMVGHTGFMEPAVDAVMSVDQAFGKLLESTKKAGGTLMITADHGNIEQMIDLRTGEPHTAHTTNPVPFIVADFSGKMNGHKLENGALEDVAPTMLQIMGIAKPGAMTGKSLIVG